MKYINWIDNGFSDIKPDNAIIWEDIITETRYYIDKNKAGEIEEKAVDFINSCHDIDTLSRYMTGEHIPQLEQSKDYEDLLRFSQLPYLIAVDNLKTPYRICDHVSIRTGILCSILSNDNSIRRFGLTKGINIFSGKSIDFKYEVDEKAIKLLDLIDGVLLGQDIPEQECEDYRFDIVKGGTVKVKQYYLETNKIKDIRGASRILDEINRELIPSYVEKFFLRENIIYCGGGNFLGIFPKGKGQEVSRSIEEMHEIESVTAQSASSFSECTLFDISKSHYQKTMSDLTQRVTDRQMSKFDWRVNPVEVTGEAQGFGVNKDKGICAHCSIREALYINNDERLCISCAKKVIKGGREAKKGYKDSFLSHCRENNITVSQVDKIDTLGDISKYSTNGDFIAVIYGDGNNMGKVIQNVHNMGQMRYFSEKTEQAVFDATYKALGSVLHNDAFEIIAIGGDDIFMIVPASCAIDIGIQLGRNFDDLFRNKSTEEYNVTMSLGIAISHSNTPIQYMFDLSQKLLKNAKKKSKAILKSGKAVSGTLDIMVLETDSAVGASLKSIRKQMIKDDNPGNTGTEPKGRNPLGLKKNLTLRPYTWDEAECIQDSIVRLKRENFRSKAYSFREAIFGMHSMEAELYYMYDMKKLKGRAPETFDNVTKCLKHLHSVFDAQGDTGMIFRVKGDGSYVYSVWPDLVELWDYCREKGGE